MLGELVIWFQGIGSLKQWGRRVYLIYVSFLLAGIQLYYRFAGMMIVFLPYKIRALVELRSSGHSKNFPRFRSRWWSSFLFYCLSETLKLWISLSNYCFMSGCLYISAVQVRGWDESRREKKERKRRQGQQVVDDGGEKFLKKMHTRWRRGTVITQ